MKCGLTREQKSLLRITALVVNGYARLLQRNCVMGRSPGGDQLEYLKIVHQRVQMARKLIEELGNPIQCVFQNDRIIFTARSGERVYLSPLGTWSFKNIRQELTPDQWMKHFLHALNASQLLDYHNRKINKGSTIQFDSNENQKKEKTKCI